MSAMGGKLPLALAPQNIPSRTIIAGESVGRPLFVSGKTAISQDDKVISQTDTLSATQSKKL